MARNPLATDPAYEERVRKRAYHLWESEGKVHGRDLEYWERARELIGMEDSAGSGLLPNPENSSAVDRRYRGSGYSGEPGRVPGCAD